MASLEPAQNKTWDLSLYELQRKPQEIITDNTEIAVSPRSLHSELMCPICLDMLKKTMTTKECLHRFCQDCIITALRSGNKECPTCRKKLVSKRSLRPDPNFDLLISKIYPSREEYEAIQEKVMAKFNQTQSQQALVNSINEGIKLQSQNRPQRFRTKGSGGGGGGGNGGGNGVSGNGGGNGVAGSVGGNGVAGSVGGNGVAGNVGGNGVAGIGGANGVTGNGGANGVAGNGGANGVTGNGAANGVVAVAGNGSAVVGNVTSGAIPVGGNGRVAGSTHNSQHHHNVSNESNTNGNESDNNTRESTNTATTATTAPVIAVNAAPTSTHSSTPVATIPSVAGSLTASTSSNRMDDGASNPPSVRSTPSPVPSNSSSSKPKRAMSVLTSERSEESESDSQMDCRTEGDSNIDTEGEGNGELGINDEIELVFKPHPTEMAGDNQLMKALKENCIRYIKTTANATVDHLSKYLALRLTLDLGSDFPEAYRMLNFCIYVAPQPSQLVILNGNQTLHQVNEKFWKVNKPMEMFYSWKKS